MLANIRTTLANFDLSRMIPRDGKEPNPPHVLPALELGGSLTRRKVGYNQHYPFSRVIPMQAPKNTNALIKINHM